MNIAKLASLALGGAVFALASNTANAESFNLRIGAGHAATLPYTSQLKDLFVPEIERRVAEETEHEVRFVEAYGGSVAKLPEVLEATQSGLLDFGALSTPFESSALFLNNYGYAVPFGVSEPSKSSQIARDLYKQFPELPGQLEARGQRVLAIMAASDYTLVTKEPWETLDDLVGQKIMAAGPNLSWVSATGATPAQGGLVEAYNSLQTGVVDGIMMHYQGVNGFKLHEVAPYIAKINLGSLPANLLTANEKRWQSLPEDVQKIILEVASEYEMAVDRLNTEGDSKSVESMIASGATLLEISDDVRVQWAKLMPDVAKAYIDEGEGRDLPMRAVVSAYIARLKAEGNTIVDFYTLD
ncbi:TRAP-type C4-dicarboxylate transport system, periplasmic component [Hoeflea sp. IMCC20628]|uniref:C4-dicarboxylate TRAP transporter substrate-binding protein n=1 Tax=Hoeflea sp. IMCC20628 TaxID=1620421 RepID=UPI00063AF4FC|nr:C4-dicarboxylate TRAP transporter substrate-binding protein [Hoeflea sp. IMCC20628]AKH98912.1 TRAP-type C4-dicarboxylate transport system, periplasmic component [Hoeflea sp. IMCC20628]